MKSRAIVLAVAGVGALLGIALLFGGERAGAAPDKKTSDVGAALEAFSEAWPSDRTDYRTDGDDSWKAYARTLRAVVDAGKTAPLEDGLKHENRQVRALCARALGYVRKRSSAPHLTKALAEDKWPTVRLLAADSLGLLDTPAAREALETASELEKVGDVSLHIDIALRRKRVPGKEYKQALLSIAETDLGAAEVGKAAPAFSMETPAGDKYSLSRYRGKRPVVLVFNYGDG